MVSVPLEGSRRPRGRRQGTEQPRRRSPRAPLRLLKPAELRYLLAGFRRSLPAGPSVEPHLAGVITDVLSHPGSLARAQIAFGILGACGFEARRARKLAAAGISYGLTGLPQCALDDRDLIQRDLQRLSLLAFALVLILFVAAFSSLFRPLAAMAALLAAVAVTLGATAVYPGHLTSLSAFFASILFGLGVDFGIHVLDRVEEFLAPALATGPARAGWAGCCSGSSIPPSPACSAWPRCSRRWRGDRASTRTTWTGSPSWRPGLRRSGRRSGADSRARRVISPSMPIRGATSGTTRPDEPSSPACVGSIRR